MTFAHWRGKITFHGLAYPKLTWGSSNFVSDLVTLGRVAMPLISHLMPVPFNALTLLVGRQEGHQACKELDVGLLVVMIWLELCATYSSSSPVVTTTYIILCFNKHRLTQVHLENGRLKWKERGLVHRPWHMPTQDLWNGDEHFPIGVRLWESLWIRQWTWTF